MADTYIDNQMCPDGLPRYFWHPISVSNDFDNTIMKQKEKANSGKHNVPEF
jgi:hypothetical protein